MQPQQVVLVIAEVECSEAETSLNPSVKNRQLTYPLNARAWHNFCYIFGLSVRSHLFFFLQIDQQTQTCLPLDGKKMS